MKKLTIFGFAGGLAASAIASGAVVAYAHGGGNHHDGAGLMDDTTMGMPMDAASMDDHMRQVMGEESYGQVRAAMGENAFEAMLKTMETACPAMTHMADAPLPPGSHESHHPGGSP